MNIHEYQGKELLRNSGVPVLDGIHCTTVEQALAAYDKLDSESRCCQVTNSCWRTRKGNIVSPRDPRTHNGRRSQNCFF